MRKFFITSVTILVPILISGCTPPSSNQIEEASELQSTSLEAKPLAETATLKISSAGNFEFMSAVYIADAMGEFEKENIKIEYVTLVAQEAVPALALDQVDISGIGLTAPFFNAVAEGAKVRIVLSGPSVPKNDGLWVRREILEGDEINEPLVIGTGQGNAWLGIVPVKRYLDSRGIDIKTVQFQQLPISELGTALELGAIDAAWLNSPSHLPFLESGSAQKVAGYENSENGVAFLFGPRLLEREPIVGQAFVRAILRTIDKYLESGYKSNPVTVGILTEKLGTSEDSLLTSGELTFGSRIESTFLTEGQQIWLDLGGILAFSAPLDPSEYLDYRFVDSIEGPQ